MPPWARLALLGGLALLVATAGVAPAAASWASAPRAESEPETVLKLVTAVVEGGSETTFTMRVPLSGDGAERIERLRAIEAGFTRDYRQALADAFAAGVLPVERAAQLARDAIGLPRLRIADGAAELTVALDVASAWKTLDGGRLLELWPLDAEGDGRVVVVLETPRAALAARPLPDEDDGEGKLRWVVPDGSPAEIRIRLGEPFPLDDGQWPLRYASSFVALGLPFLVLLLAALWRRRPAASELFPLAAAGVALAVAGAAIYAPQGLVEAPGSSGYRFVEALIPALGTVGFVGLAWWGRWRSLALWTVLSAGASVALAVVIAQDASFAVERPGVKSEDVLGEVAAKARYLVRDDGDLIAACGLAILLTALVLAGAVRWLARLRDRPLLAEARRRRRLLLLIGAAILLVATAVVAQLVLAARSNGDLADLFTEEPPWSARLGTLLDPFSFMLANLARNLALVLLALALAAWLWRRVGHRDLTFASWFECLAVGLLFATVVTGLGGRINGYAVPIPFLLSLAGATVALRVLSRSPRGRRVARRRTKATAKELLADAARLALDRRRRHALRDQLIAGEVGEREHGRAIGELDERREQLASRKALGRIDRSRWPREALAFALATGAGARTRFAGLLRGGWPIFVLPVAYTVVVLITLSAPYAFSAENPIGGAFLATALVDQALTWPIVAWCFVVAQPILPGHVGPVKGLWVGLFSAAPFGISSLVLDDPLGREQWLFLSAELTLFLVVVGLYLDYRAVRATDRDLRDLGELYNVTSVRATLAYVAPLALILFGVIRGLASGEGASALEELVSNASSLLPGGA